MQTEDTNSSSATDDGRPSTSSDPQTTQTASVEGGTSTTDASTTDTSTADATASESGSTTSSESTTSTETSAVTTLGAESSTGASGSESSTSDGGGGAVCGNAVVEGDEACDDGNREPGDGCESDCTSSDDVEPEWMLEVGGVFTHFECGTGVAFDGDGNLVIAGYVEPHGIWIRKYDPDYVELWTVTYPSGLTYTCPGATVSVAVDLDGNIAFAGPQDVGPGDVDILYGKLDPDGAELWSAHYGHAWGEIDVPGGLATDVDGGLLITGSLEVVQSTSDLWVGRYTGDGLLVWEDTYDGGFGSDAGFGVAGDAEGNVLVTGATWNADGNLDIFVRKYDPEGAELWTDIVAGAAGQYDFGFAVHAHHEAEVVVAGIIREAPNNGDGWLQRYDESGDVVLTQTYAGAEDGNDGILGTAAWPGGSVAAGGMDGVPWIGKLAADGTPTWERTFVSLPGAAWSDVAVASDGRIAVAGEFNSGGQSGSEAVWAVYPQ